MAAGGHEGDGSLGEGDGSTAIEVYHLGRGAGGEFVVAADAPEAGGTDEPADLEIVLSCHCPMQGIDSLIGGEVAGEDAAGSDELISESLELLLATGDEPKLVCAVFHGKVELAGVFASQPARGAGYDSYVHGILLLLSVTRFVFKG